jgi:hypothetical protein
MHVVSILDRHARRASALSRAVTNDFELKSRYKKVTARNVYAGDDPQQELRRVTQHWIFSTAVTGPYIVTSYLLRYFTF